MSFVTWLGRRIKRKLFGVKFEWVRYYQEQILHDKSYSLMITVVFGGLFEVLVVIANTIFVNDREFGITLMKCAPALVVAFYCYHWLAALYEVYANERQQTWDALNK